MHFANFDLFYKWHFYAPLKSNNIIVFFSNKINKINTNAQGGFRIAPCAIKEQKENGPSLEGNQQQTNETNGAKNHENERRN